MGMRAVPSLYLHTVNIPNKFHGRRIRYSPIPHGTQNCASSMTLSIPDLSPQKRSILPRVVTRRVMCRPSREHDRDVGHLFARHLFASSDEFLIPNDHLSRELIRSLDVTIRPNRPRRNRVELIEADVGIPACAVRVRSPIRGD